MRDGKYNPDRGALSTFLYAVATNIWLRHQRKSAGTREVLTDGERLAGSLLGESDDPARAVAFAELLSAVLKRVTGAEGDLSAEERTVLVHLADGASDRDLAVILGVAPSTAHARRVGALAKLRAALVGLGYRSEDGSAER